MHWTSIGEAQLHTCRYFINTKDEKGTWYWRFLTILKRKFLQHWNATINSYRSDNHLIFCFVCYDRSSVHGKFIEIIWGIALKLGKLLKIRQLLILNENLFIRYLLDSKLESNTEFKATAFLRTRSYQHWKIIQNALKRYRENIDKTFKMHWTIIGKALKRSHT